MLPEKDGESIDPSLIDDEIALAGALIIEDEYDPDVVPLIEEDTEPVGPSLDIEVRVLDSSLLSDIDCNLVGFTLSDGRVLMESRLPRDE